MPSPPWGREGGPPPAFSSAGAGRVRGWWAGARPSPGYIAPLKALGKDHATSSTFSRNVGTALRCLWFQGIDPLTPRPLSPKGERGESRNSSAGHYRESGNDRRVEKDLIPNDTTIKPRDCCSC